MELKKFNIALICLSLVVAGCSNGNKAANSPGELNETSLASASGSIGRITMAAVSSAPGTLLVGEDQNFTVASNTVVYYGAGSTFIQKTVSGSATCSNIFFGSDPLPNVVKACYAGTSTSPAPAPAPSASGTLIAVENQSFAVASNTVVSYGAGSSFIQKTVSGSNNCSNAFFGNDPVPGVLKACYVAGTSSPAPAPTPAPSGSQTLVAIENQSFTVASNTIVSYGAGSSFIRKTVSGSNTCSNAFFGNDPVPGVLKACYVAGTSSPAPAPAPGNKAPTHIACVGDSITYGYLASSGKSYPSELQRLFGSGVKVGNFGVSGATLLNSADMPYTRQSAYNDATNFVANAGTNAVVDVVIMLGTNDSKPQNWSASSSTQFTNDYIALINHFANLPTHPRIYVALPANAYCGLSTTPCSNAAYSINGTVIAQQIVPLIRNLAGSQNITIIDINAQMNNPSYFQDGVHPSDQGYTVLGQDIYSGLTVAP